jgi:peptidoglycan/xylan/chitin deacetylase (PgdA/CDA1 family)
MDSSEDPSTQMNFRSQLRTRLIQSTTFSHLDALAFRLQKLRHRPQAIVVAMHETPVSLQARFRQQLEWASQRFTITSLEGLAELWTQQQRRQFQPTDKPLLLFTFDDGRESNYQVAAPLLESFGGRGVFFVVPEFAECSEPAVALSFYRTHINPDSSSGAGPEQDWKPMSPTQIADLASRGHAIGNHTLTHARLRNLSIERLEKEIGDSARKLAAWANHSIDAFAWTFEWDAIDANAWQVIRRYHRFCFSPCAGAIDHRFDQTSLLWRREVEVRYSSAELRFAYSGLVDLWWRSRRKRLQQMLQSR